MRSSSQRNAVPPELGNLSELTELGLNSNQLTGPLPPELGQLNKMVRLWVDLNGLSGPIPLEFVNMPLTTFYWASTDLCAPVDEGFQAWLRSIEDYGGGENCSSGDASRPGEDSPGRMRAK